MLSELPQKLSTVKLLDSPDKRELYVWGTAEQHDEFSKLLEGLDKPLPTSDSKLPKTYKVDFQNVTLVQQILTAEFADATITLDTDGKMLTVVAEEPTHAKLAARLELFQESFPKKTPTRLENYSVKGMTAEVLQTTLAPLLAKARVNVDSKNARLLVTADEETHAEIKKLIAALSDSATPGMQKVAIVYPIDHAKATQVKLVIDQLGLGVQAVADDILKQVVITGTIEDHAVVKSMVAQMDRPSLGTTDKQIRTFDTKKVFVSIFAACASKALARIGILSRPCQQPRDRFRKRSTTGCRNRCDGSTDRFARRKHAIRKDLFDCIGGYAYVASYSRANRSTSLAQRRHHFTNHYSLGQRRTACASRSSD